MIINPALILAGTWRAPRGERTRTVYRDAPKPLPPRKRYRTVVDGYRCVRCSLMHPAHSDYHNRWCRECNAQLLRLTHEEKFYD